MNTLLMRAQQVVKHTCWISGYTKCFVFRRLSGSGDQASSSEKGANENNFGRGRDLLVRKDQAAHAAYKAAAAAPAGGSRARRVNAFRRRDVSRSGCELFVSGQVIAFAIRGNRLKRKLRRKCDVDRLCIRWTGDCAERVLHAASHYFRMCGKSAVNFRLLHEQVAASVDECVPVGVGAVGHAVPASVAATMVGRYKLQQDILPARSLSADILRLLCDMFSEYMDCRRLHNWTVCSSSPSIKKKLDLHSEQG